MEGVSDSKYFPAADPPACSCPGWYWRRRCRHVDELRVALALIASNRAKWVEREATAWARHWLMCWPRSAATSLTRTPQKARGTQPSGQDDFLSWTFMTLFLVNVHRPHIGSS